MTSSRDLPETAAAADVPAGIEEREGHVGRQAMTNSRDLPETAAAADVPAGIEEREGHVGRQAMTSSRDWPKPAAAADVPAGIEESAVIRPESANAFAAPPTGAPEPEQWHVPAVGIDGATSAAAADEPREGEGVPAAAPPVDEPELPPVALPAAVVEAGQAAPAAIGPGPAPVAVPRQRAPVVGKPHKKRRLIDARERLAPHLPLPIPVGDDGRCAVAAQLINDRLAEPFQNLPVNGKDRIHLVLPGTAPYSGYDYLMNAAAEFLEGDQNQD